MRNIFRNGFIACTFIVAAGAGIARAQELPAAHDFVLNHAVQFDLHAQANGRDYRIFVSTPAGEAPATGYPVIYTTDGNAMFPQLAATANLMRMNGRAVVVGIGYPGDAQFDVNRRYYDLTPKTPDDVVRASGRGGAGRETGGNDLFLDFIENQLKPIVEKEYKIDRNRQTLFGHSLGGLFVLHTLFSRPESFQNYVAAAPSIWWNDQSILAEEKAFLQKWQGRTLNAKVLVITNTDPTLRRRPGFAGPTGMQGRARDGDAATPAATNPRQASMANAGSIVDSLKTVTGVAADSKVIENESHISMVPGAVSDALRFVLGDSGRPPRAGAE